MVLTNSSLTRLKHIFNSLLVEPSRASQSLPITNLVDLMIKVDQTTLPVHDELAAAIRLRWMLDPKTGADSLRMVCALFYSEDALLV